VTGDSTVKGFEGWFAVDGYDLGVQHTASIGSGTGGAGAGKAQFSPLTVDIHSLAGLAPLLGDVASGHALKSVELVGVETLKDQNIKVYDVNLSDVLVSSFQQDPSAKGVETALSFDFAKISLRSAGREERNARHPADSGLGPAAEQGRRRGGHERYRRQRCDNR
jgi:type VI protein secretion system component Hcp